MWTPSSEDACCARPTSAWSASPRAVGTRVAAPWGDADGTGPREIEARVRSSRAAVFLMGGLMGGLPDKSFFPPERSIDEILFLGSRLRGEVLFEPFGDRHGRADPVGRFAKTVPFVRK